MDYSTLHPSLSLTDAIVHRARRASERRLSLDVCAGGLVALASAFWKPAGWGVIVSAAACFAAFGSWGLADRLLNESSGLSPRPGVVASLLILRTVAVTIGVAAALVLLFGIAGVAMGTWIS